MTGNSLRGLEEAIKFGGLQHYVSIETENHAPGHGKLRGDPLQGLRVQPGVTVFGDEPQTRDVVERGRCGTLRSLRLVQLIV